MDPNHQTTLDRQQFLSQIQKLKETGKLTPGKVAVLQPQFKLNLVLDIDHTLIFSIEKSLYPNLYAEQSKNWPNKIHEIKFTMSDEHNTISKEIEMWIIVRFGVLEMLEFLSSYCNLYVYSLGIKAYIFAILDIIDPDSKYFKDREATVVCPENKKEQLMMHKLGKQLD